MDRSELLPDSEKLKDGPGFVRRQPLCARSATSTAAPLKIRLMHMKSRSQVNLSLSQIVAQVFRPWLFSRWLWLWALGCGCCWRWSIPPLVSTAGTSRRVIKQRSANAIERWRWGLLAHIPSNLLHTRMHLRPKHPPFATSFGSPHCSDVQPPLLAWLIRRLLVLRAAAVNSSA
jgi:hypothetical protein